MIGSRRLRLVLGVVVVLIVAGPIRADLAGSVLREASERLTRGLRGPSFPPVTRPAARLADDAARAVARHPAVGTSSSAWAVKAMPALTPRNARRLAMLAQDGTLVHSGRWGELVAVIERHGDRAMEFVWRHKGALAVSTILGSFLAQPEAFLGGGRELSPVEGRTGVRPLVESAGSGVVRLLGVVPWVIPMGLGLVAALVVLGPLLRTVGKLRRRPIR